MRSYVYAVLFIIVYILRYIHIYIYTLRGNAAILEFAGGRRIRPRTVCVRSELVNK